MTNKTFLFGSANNQFHANNVPLRGDIWTFGEVNPTAFYENQNDRLFKVTSLETEAFPSRLDIQPIIPPVEEPTVKQGPAPRVFIPVTRP